ncbi:MAG: hypothetical protein RI842_08455, partial [Schleiferiaceae bacterium]|nr:hypothetical protein [Schleiferiaceae bacterium]
EHFLGKHLATGESGLYRQTLFNGVHQLPGQGVVGSFDFHLNPHLEEKRSTPAGLELAGFFAL